MTKSTITARRRIMAIFPGRRPRWRNTCASFLAHHILVAPARLARRLRRCDLSSRAADQLRAERNAAHGEDRDPAQYQRPRSMPAVPTPARRRPHKAATGTISSVTMSSHDWITPKPALDYLPSAILGCRLRPGTYRDSPRRDGPARGK